MPPKRKAAATKEAPSKRPRTITNTAQSASEVITSTETPTGKTVGSKSKTKSAAKPARKAQKQSGPEEPPGDDQDALTQAVGSKAKQYWLMKAEPEDRFENGHNVKFSIDDLEAATKPEPWDGVRNYQARNNMMAMKKGDLAFFYHSNCAMPGIVGIMRIAEEHSVDESAFDTGHPYYDAKSQREKPKWHLVHVEFVKKFKEKISLKAIQQNAASTEELADMDLLRYKRLSVTGVRPDEWDFILKWAGEPAITGSLTE